MAGIEVTPRVFLPFERSSFEASIRLSMNQSFASRFFRLRDYSYPVCAEKWVETCRDNQVPLQLKTIGGKGRIKIFFFQSFYINMNGLEFP